MAWEVQKVAVEMARRLVDCLETVETVELAAHFHPAAGACFPR